MTILPLRRLILVCAVALCAAASLAILVTAGPADADLNSRIQSKGDRADALRAAVASESAKIRSSAGGLAAAQRRLSAIQADIGVAQARLEGVERDLNSARDRLTRLVKRQLEATDALRSNLQAAYRNPPPDLVSVVITAKGFTDLLERAEFFKRIGGQNARIMDRARTSRAVVTKQAGKLAEAQQTQLRVGEELERRRESAQTLQSALLAEQQRRLSRRDARRGALQDIKAQVASLRKRLAKTARAGIRTNPGGTAQPPSGAPAAVGLVTAAANAIAGLPYLYGGGHAGFKDTAYDCSGSISYALAAAGLVSSPMASGPFMTWGDPGPGKWITIYANPGHAFMVVGGRRFDTSALSGGGTRWTSEMRSTSGFIARHPPGL
ncbi:MAG: coiled-coil domain-containing protein [Solirubrobacteraceae bacterium]